MNDSGTNADRMAIQRQRVERAGCSGTCAWPAAPSDITWPARSDVCTFGFAPTIHPLPQCPPAIGVCQLASVEVTLSFREKLPIPETRRKTRNRVAIVGQSSSFRNVADGQRGLQGVQRYRNT